MKTFLPLLLFVAACATEAPTPQASCTSCHGSESSSAPPVALGGITDPTSRGVGAHTAHLTDNVRFRAVACNECHVVPATVDAEGHIDDPWPAETRWGDLGKTDGAEITWDTDTLTCSGSYCHGATLSGGTYTDPVWTDVSGQATNCDSCHGFPPPAPHPQTGACGDCHAPTASGSTIADNTTHMDGILQVTGELGCDGCHGANGDPAPPPDLSGSEDTTSPGVGAHAAHLGATTGAPVSCETCHVVPATADAAGHLDEGAPDPADVVFSGVAVTDGFAASYDPTTNTCTVYCHGTADLGATVPAPEWTLVDGTQAACGACHGSPPPAPHPGSTNCTGCHPGGGTTDATAHVNGSVD